MLKRLMPSKPVARTAICWGAAVLLAAVALGGLLDTAGTVLYGVAALGCVAAGRWMST